MKIYRYLFPVLFFCIAAVSAEYQVDLEQKNVVKFISKAPMESFEGVTDKIDGYVTWEDEDFTNNSEIYFEVDLNSLDTGIGLRNRHMRDNYLETDKYPFTHFAGKIVEAIKQDDGSVKVKAEGTMFIHGVEKPITVEGIFMPVENGYRITTGFVVKLTDYKIKVPKLMFFKIDERMKLHLDFFVKEVSENQ